MSPGAGVHPGLALVLLALCLGCSGTAAVEADADLPADGYRDVSDTHLDVPDVGGPSMDAAVADLDGDGDLDVLVAMEFSPNLLLLNDGNGRLTLAPAGALPGSARDSEDIAIADFDGDGNLDAFIVSEDDQVNELYLGDGDGGFTDASERIPVQGVSNAVVSADLSGDGLPDIIIGNNGQNALLIGTPEGEFVDETGARLPSILDVTQDVELGDIDGDGDLDLLVGNEDDNRVLVNDGTGVFSDETDSRLPIPDATPEETREADLGDIDGDGDLDILLANVSLFVPGADRQNRLLVNDGSGVFEDAPAGQLPADDDQSFDGDFFDLDGDGDLDILTSNGLSTVTPYRGYRNDGSGRFEDASASLFPSAPAGLGFDAELADLDGDGSPDLYLAGRGSRDLVLLGP